MMEMGLLVGKYLSLWVCGMWYVVIKKNIDAKIINLKNNLI